MRIGFEVRCPWNQVDLGSFSFDDRYRINVCSLGGVFWRLVRCSSLVVRLQFGGIVLGLDD